MNYDEELQQAIIDAGMADDKEEAESYMNVHYLGDTKWSLWTLTTADGNTHVFTRE